MLILHRDALDFGLFKSGCVVFGEVHEVSVCVKQGHSNEYNIINTDLLNSLGAREPIRLFSSIGVALVLVKPHLSRFLGCHKVELVLALHCPIWSFEAAFKCDGFVGIDI